LGLLIGFDSEYSAFPFAALDLASPVIDRAVGWIDARLAVGLAEPGIFVLVVSVLLWSGHCSLPFLICRYIILHHSYQVNPQSVPGVWQYSNTSTKIAQMIVW
jgi:hypothetical protein